MPDDRCDTSVYLALDSDPHERPGLTTLQAKKDYVLIAGLGHWAIWAKMNPLTKSEDGAISGL